MLDSEEHLYFQNASLSDRSKTLGDLWDVGQSGILDPVGKKIF